MCAMDTAQRPLLVLRPLGAAPAVLTQLELKSPEAMTKLLVNQIVDKLVNHNKNLYMHIL